MARMSPVRAMLAALALAAVTAPGLSRAQTCSFSAGPTSLAFGSYNPANATPTDSSATFTYGCSSARARPVVIDLNPGSYGSFATRMMGLGADRLNYNLYTTAQRSTNGIWGDGTGGSVEVSSVPQGSTHGATLTIYGRIDAGQWVTAGTYSDTIVVTLNY
jgi:spore coat protein U-like protein